MVGRALPEAARLRVQRRAAQAHPQELAPRRRPQPQRQDGTVRVARAGGGGGGLGLGLGLGLGELEPRQGVQRARGRQGRSGRDAGRGQGRGGQRGGQQLQQEQQLVEADEVGGELAEESGIELPLGGGQLASEDGVEGVLNPEGRRRGRRSRGHSAPHPQVGRTAAGRSATRPTAAGAGSSRRHNYAVLTERLILAARRLVGHTRNMALAACLIRYSSCNSPGSFWEVLAQVGSRLWFVHFDIFLYWILDPMLLVGFSTFNSRNVSKTKC